MAFPGLESLNDTSIAGVMSFPITGDFYFYAKILLGIWIVIAFSFYFEEKKRLGKGNMLSSFAVSSLAVIVLAGIGSLFDIIPLEVLVPTIVLGAVIIFIWFIREK